MLTIAKLGVGQENYYLAKVARGIEDYYTGDGETRGAWVGRGAARLGLAGDVPGAQLRAALGGLDPTTGNRLSGRLGAKRVPGWDLTFCAPKSVSVLWGLADTQVASEVVAAHETAVAEAIRYLERHATISRRRVAGFVQQIRAEGLVIAAFRHRTSRAGDPHLHTHALAANLAERVDGGWGALHSPVLYKHARTAGFVYQAVLRGELTERLGVAWEPVHNGYAEIAGIDRRLLDWFSKRHTDITTELGTTDASRYETEVAQRRTKTAKDYTVDPAALRDQWAAEASDVGIDAAHVVGAATGHRQSPLDGDLEWVVDAMTAPDGLTAFQASFDRRDVTRAWCESLPPAMRPSLDALEDLTDLAISDGRVVPVVHRAPAVIGTEQPERPDGTVASPVAGDRRWSTTEMLAVEQRLLDYGAKSRGVGAGQVPPAVVDAVLADRADLSGEQHDMVRTITTSGDGIDVVVGRAGTGKTYALAAAAEVWRAAGFRPIGIALAARAAAELETAAGIRSTTVAQFLLDSDSAPRGLIDDRHVVVVDEAGMVDTRRLARVVRHVEAAGAKTVLVGDQHQLPAVEAGGAFAALVARLPTTELAENRRQVEQWERAALDRLRTADGGRHGVDEVVATYGDHGRLHFGATPSSVRGAMVEDWYEARRKGARVAMVALRRSDVDELNLRARSLLIADGTVETTGITHDGRTYSVGDRIVCLNNDRRVGVHNAMFGRVTGIDLDARSLTVEPEEGGRRVLVPWHYIADGHVAHGYATTIHKAQGATYDRTLLLGDDRLYRQAGYTGLSRGRERNDIYLVVDDDREHDVELARHGQAPPDEPVERLVKALHRDGAKVLATEERHCERRQPGVSLALSDLWAERDAAALAERHGDADSGGECDLERIADLDDAIDRRARLAGRAAEIDRPRDVLDLIGDPPTSLLGRDDWRAAAAAIESYRARWGAPANSAVDAELGSVEQIHHLVTVQNRIARCAEAAREHAVELA